MFAVCFAVIQWQGCERGCPLSLAGANASRGAAREGFHLISARWLSGHRSKPSAAHNFIIDPTKLYTAPPNIFSLKSLEVFL